MNTRGFGRWASRYDYVVLKIRVGLYGTMIVNVTCQFVDFCLGIFFLPLVRGDEYQHAWATEN